MARCTTAIGPTAMSATALTETAVGTSWQVPKGARKIEGVWISYCVASTYDEAKPHHPQLRITSADTKVTVEPCTILVQGAASLKTSTGVEGTGLTETYHFRPLNIPVSGGEVFYFYGTVLVTVTTAGWMGVTVQFNDNGGDAPAIGNFNGAGGQYHYKANSAVTASVTTTLVKTLETTTYRTAGAHKITGLYGQISITTAAAATGINGKFRFESGDFKVPYEVSMMNAPAHSFLSAGGNATHLSFKEGLDIPTADQTTIQGSFTNGATNIAGSFITGVQYQ
jgi:hypothetical protein